jgi:hypothetical protein
MGELPKSFTDAVFAVGIQKIVNDYGAALASRKSLFADVSELPYPKYLIKAAILVAISSTCDEKMKARLKANFMSLADWQEGIGPGPHDIDVADRPGETTQEHAKRFLQGAPAYMSLSKRSITEMEGLLAELKSLGL